MEATKAAPRALARLFPLILICGCPAFAIAADDACADQSKTDALATVAKLPVDSRCDALRRLYDSGSRACFKSDMESACGIKPAPARGALDDLLDLESEPAPKPAIQPESKPAAPSPVDPLEALMRDEDTERAEQERRNLLIRQQEEAVQREQAEVERQQAEIKRKQDEYQRRLDAAEEADSPPPQQSPSVGSVLFGALAQTMITKSTGNAALGQAVGQAAGLDSASSQILADGYKKDQEAQAELLRQKQAALAAAQERLRQARQSSQQPVAAAVKPQVNTVSVVRATPPAVPATPAPRATPPPAAHIDNSRDRSNCVVLDSTSEQARFDGHHFINRCSEPVSIRWCVNDDGPGFHCSAKSADVMPSHLEGGGMTLPDIRPGDFQSSAVSVQRPIFFMACANSDKLTSPYLVSGPPAVRGFCWVSP